MQVEKKIILLTSGIIIFTVGLSIFLSRFTIDSDFPVFYCAARTILDPSAPKISVYDIEHLGEYSIPENIRNGAFIYSMPAAYIFSPIALMPYYSAKALIIFFSITGYIIAIILVLRTNQATDRWFVYPLAASCLWLPFIQTMRAGQVDGIIIFLLSIAVFFATKNHPTFCGIFLSFAAFFKLFPIAIAMVLGLKNWRILTAFSMTFVASFLIPGSLEWFPAIGNIYKGGYTPIFLYLKNYSIVWFGMYAATVAGLTALIAFRSEGVDYHALVSFSIPGVLLTMPIVEYYHLTLLMYSYVFLLVSHRNNNRFLMLLTFFSFLTINAAFFFSPASAYFVKKPFFSKSLVMVGLCLIWFAYAKMLSTKQRKFQAGKVAQA